MVRVVVVEGDPAVAERVGRALAGAPGLRATFHASLAAALAATRDEAPVVPDAAIVALDLPDSRGIETYERFRSAVEAVPVVVLTRGGDGSAGLAALSRGAQDALDTSALERVDLVRALHHAIERHRVERALRDDFRLAEQKIRRLNRVHAVLSRINALVVRVAARQDLFAEACRITVEDGGFAFAWIGILDPGAAHVRPVAWSGATPELTAAMQGDLVRRAPTKESLVARALAERRPIIANHVVLEDDLRAALETSGAALELKSAAILPLLVSGHAIGVLTLYASEAGFFDGAEVKLLRELADDIGFALDHIDTSERLDYLSFYDPLTGLANRSLFLTRLASMVSNAFRDGDRFAVCILDIEHFKSINDTLGRRAGDAILQEVGRRMSECIGHADRVARLGADQFVVVIPDWRTEDALSAPALTRVRDPLVHPFFVEGNELHLAARCGVSLFPIDGEDAETLLHNAESALKRAKRTGEPILFYTEEMSRRIAGKLALETRLRQAVDNEEFILHYQPQIDLETGRMVGAEALIRWATPDGAIVPPAEFLPLLEESGLILPVGAWCLRRAMRDHGEWSARGLNPPRIMVNVSSLQLRQRDFVTGVEQAVLAQAAVSPIDLEITESIIMENVDTVTEKLRALRAVGIRIAIDDFGTGYSSLAYLSKLPVDALKIDRSFVSTMLSDRTTMTLVQTIISLANALRLRVVAEGVEKEEQANILRLLRCDEMQGFLFSPPLPVPEFTALLTALDRNASPAWGPAATRSRAASPAAVA